MRAEHTTPRSALSAAALPNFLLLFAPLLYLEAAWAANGQAFSLIQTSARAGFVFLVYLAAWSGRPLRKASGELVIPAQAAALPALAGLALVIYLQQGAASAAWLLAAALFSLLLVLSSLYRGRLEWVWLLALAGAAGALLAVGAQIETRFSEEEFFAAVQAAILAGFWLLLRLAWSRSLPARSWPAALRGFKISPGWLAAVLMITLSAAAVPTLRAYQNSFYPPEAPAFPGISTESPFLCRQIEEDNGKTYHGSDVFLRILERVAAHPQKKAPEYGLLALGTNEQGWLNDFRESLLQEARAGAFTQPANSIKYGQYQASMRVYFYTRVREAFPDLFSVEEEKRLQDWFAAVNRRAQTVEWVDWMYALAFGMQPQGPYENQETGAGLLSLLEWQNLADPTLSAENRAYLQQHLGGWNLGFRVTDDAILYQPEWIYNSYFQALNEGAFDQDNARLSFEWLLLQSPPDGSPLRYNHVGAANLASPAYLGTQLTGEQDFLWLAGRSLDYLEASNMPLSAAPGIERVVDMMSSSPQSGSCLLYGRSGVPTQVGMLAPDKIVFRDGWDEDDSYLLLNLRFTGWHRYKAANSIVLISKSDALVNEEAGGKTFAWLPTGRSLFRDKRIPRENLNGLLIGRSGLSAAVFGLTGIGSPWAQDPSYYASVERFENHPGYDLSSTLLEDWHGWQHRRTIYFYHHGPLVVLDQADGPANSRSALAWHTTGSSPLQENRIVLRDGADPAALVLLPIESGIISAEPRGESGESGLRIEFQPQQKGSLRLATVFLTGKWSDAAVQLAVQDGKQAVQITLAGEEILIPLEMNADDE